MISGDVAGPPAWRVAVAVGVVAALATALVLVSRSPDRAEPAVSAPVATSQLAAIPEPAAAPPLPEPGEILPALDAALAAWGAFAVTGDLSVLEDSFASPGPQWAQLASEAEAIAADPPGPPPYVFDVVEYGGATTEGAVAEVVASIRLSRLGEETASFRWKIELRWDRETARWQLWTVSDAGG